MTEKVDIRTAAGVELRAIPMSPSPDYMAGADGRIYSRLRHKGFGRWKYVDWHPVGPGRRERNRTVVIDHGGRKISLSLARIICTAFHGPPPSEASRVRHLDGDLDNNRAENLQWGTQQEAWADEHGLRLAPGERRRAHRLSKDDRAHLRWAVTMGLCSQRQAARTLGIALSTVQAILHESAPQAREAAVEEAAVEEAVDGEQPGTDLPDDESQH
ncbi:HNH endonuclease [Anaeromyxobacter paludicola]|uniref:HNH nuclease domain-containing protein n=1 Tax=Anaeromyxobacter paludicola TaxID=2918171 RepID=A0ABM7XBH5_9BACT|nr:HNH endonuclease [Anaeromyxobacter paludicola]BDG09210.1 hypothetical protein AMPC_23230 [Anaeromyxobacter paludicola]